MTKGEIRIAVREKIAAFTSVAAAEKSTAIRRHIIRDPAWKSANVVALFASQSSEADLDPLWSDIGGKRVAYPRVSGDSIQFIEVSAVHDLKVARWNLREPDASQIRRISPLEIDLILVPGTAFTAKGERLGRGGGFYDRLLAHPEFPAKKIGVCFDVQIFPEIPIEPHDRAVDHVITESGIVRAT
ncbi:MAG: 5-formyltetrahydrofolate cyclo-ligase [Verrucomicrobiota bacterium]|nr:5-formyltetrahydrofolate cyclo-ligase [Verrucomicrobiota bacterium]